MPHQCTNCGRVFADGSKQMLSGCPDCGGNKFQYHPGEVPDEPSSADPPDRPDDGVSGTVGKAAAKVRDFVGDSGQASAAAESPDDATETPAATTSDQGAGTAPAGSDDTGTAADANSPDPSAADRAEPTADSEEDVAQASARTEMVDDDDLPSASDGRVVSAPSNDDRPDMEELREELNSQFESIRIVAPGTYELNLMELYDREEYVIALQENGRYVIEVPDAWNATRNDSSN